MEQKANDRRSVLMMVTSMLVFGTIGVFRRYIPVSSGFLAFARGILGGLCIFTFLRLTKRKPAGKLPTRALPWLILSGMLMLRYLKETEAADKLENAVAEVIKEGKDVTYDLKPNRDDPTAVGTQEMAEAICKKMR